MFPDVRVSAAVRRDGALRAARLAGQVRYRHLAEDRMAEMLATEVIQASTDFDDTECIIGVFIVYVPPDTVDDRRLRLPLPTGSTPRLV